MTTENQPTAADECRRATRFPAQVDCVGVKLYLAARVVDESFTGIGIEIREPAAFVVGQIVTIDYNGRPMPAIVRRTEPREDGALLVGLEWQVPEAT